MLAQEIGGAIQTWAGRTVERLVGMTDEEYLWEPVPGCWTLRHTPEGSWRADLGPRGTTWTPMAPSPVTTIAWRMWHLGASPSPVWPSTSAESARAFAEAWFSQPLPRSAPGIGTAGDAVEALDRHWSTVGRLVASFPDDDLLQPIGEVGGRFGHGSIHSLITHIADELIHHSAEIALLRDLYEGGFSTEPDGTG